MVSRVEKNGIGRLPPDAVNAQQLLAQIGRRRAKHPCERAAVPISQEFDERLELSRLLPEITRRPHQALQFCRRNALERGEGEQPLAAQVPNGALDV